LLFFSLASVASANTARIFTNAFGCATKGVEGCLTPDPYPLTAPGGVAVNESTGDVYVANHAGDNVQDIEVDATGGTFELTFENPLTDVKGKTGPIIARKNESLDEETKSFEEIAQGLEAAGAGKGNAVDLPTTVGKNGIPSITVEFTGEFADLHVPQLTAETAGLTGPGAAVNITTPSVGGPGDEVQEFNEKGEFVLMFGNKVNKTKAGGLPTEADVCTEVEVKMGVECQRGAPGSEPGQFERPAYVAVDSSTGDVYVADGEHEFQEEGVAARFLPERVTKFSEKGEVVSTWGDGGPGETPNGQLVGKPEGAECVAPAKACPAAEPFLYISGIAVDPKGNLWVDGSSTTIPGFQGNPGQRLFEFARAGAGTFTGDAWSPNAGEDGQSGVSPNELGIAVDSEDNVYLGGQTYDSAGTVISASISTAGFVVGAVDSSGHAYVNTAKEIQVFLDCRAHLVGECKPTETFGSAHPPGAGKLAVDSAAAGGTLYAAGSQSGQVSVYSNEVVAGVVTGKPSGVKLPEATLNGTVNPAGVPLEECFFEWGETTNYGNRAECEKPNAAEVGKGTVEVPVRAKIEGVVAGHTYHYRLVAIDANDVHEPSVGNGQDVVFGPPAIVREASADVAAISATVLAEVQAQNLDTRVRVEYGTEAGTYPDKPAAVDGGAGAGVATVPIELTGLTPGTVYHYRFVAENVLGTFEGADHAFKTQGAGAFVLPDGRSWELASPPDLRGAAIEPLNTANEGGQGGVTEAAAQGGAITYVTSAPVEPDVRGYQEFSQALSRRTSSGWSSRALSVAHAPATPTGVSFSGREYRWFSEDLSLAAVGPAGGFTPPSLEETRTGALTALGGTFLGASPDGSHIVVATGSPTDEIFDLSEYTAGQPLARVGEGALGDVSPSVQVARRAISNDGSRVFFTTGTKMDGEPLKLYMRDTVKGETILIAEGSSTLFEDANTAGNLVFFNGQECEVIEVAGKLVECHVIAQDGHVIGSSEDGSWFYYSINNELFVSHDGVPKLISSDSGPIGGGSLLLNMTARVSPNGQWLAFMSQGSLTGYDNRDAVSGEPDEEVYLYDGETGQLACASCNPTGARPHGRKYQLTGRAEGISTIPLVGGFKEWPGNTWLAANVPAWTEGGQVGSDDLYSNQPRYLSNSGRLFFNSSDALVPKDVNEQEDVYEYEPEGVPAGAHACSAAAASGSEVYKPAQPFDAEGQKGEEGAGCVSLISSGTSPDESAFLDASESGGEGPHGEELQEGGGDVFFLTASHLQPQDVEDGNAIYDAHECTTESPCLTPPSSAPPCETAEGCRGAPAPQPGIYGAPPSATFNGLGNLTPTVTPPAVVKPKPLTKAQKLAAALKVCKRDKKKAKRVACEKQAKKKYAVAKKSAHINRRAK
jgi:DNA-binding beta-propeller fold protein YncE